MLNKKKKSNIDNDGNAGNVEQTNEIKDEIVNKKKSKKARSFSSFEVVFLLFIFLMFGIVLGCMITLCGKSVLGFRLDSDLMEFTSVYNYIKNNYYEDVDSKDLIKSSISGMLGSLDDEYSYYMDKENTESFNTSVDGKYVGIGLTIQYYEGVTTVIDMYEGSPAAKSGLKSGDVIIKVNNKDVTKKDSNQIAKMITGKVGKEVSITIKRDDKEFTYKMKISEIEIPSVFSEIKEENNHKIGYLSIDNFAANTYKQFKSHLTKLEKAKIDSLIIDVRNNSGGHLSQVKEILELFFDKKKVLYQIETKGKPEKVYSSSNDSRKYKVVILTNEASASASEVLAVCFKENYKNATIVGTTTYGKGTVQKAVDLSSGSSIKFTTQKWLTPSGDWINEKGVKPDVEVKNNDDNEEDFQLKEALKILSEK